MHVSNAADILGRIKTLVRFRRYRLRLHAIRHMIEEGFDERDIVEVLTGPRSRRYRDRVHSTVTVVGDAIQAREEAMKDMTKKPCSDCGGTLRSRRISQEYEREGVRIKVAGVRALVCTRCGEVYFLPGAAGLLAKATRSLLDLAIAGRQHRGSLTARIS